MASEIETLKRQFLEHLEIEKGSSLKTIENYERYLNRFFEFGKIKNAKDINDTVVREFRLWLNRQLANNKNINKTLSKKTQNYYLIALRMFLKYLTKRRIESMHSDQIDLAKVTERSLDLISNTELSRLLNAPDGNDIKSLRDKAIMELLFSTGLRVSELCSLTNDLDLTADEFSIRGKGGKVRVVFLSDKAKDAIKKYMALRKDMEEALFTQVGSEIIYKKPDSKNGKKEIKALTRRSIERIVKH